MEQQEQEEIIIADMNEYGEDILLKVNSCEEEEDTTIEAKGIRQKINEQDRKKDEAKRTDRQKNENIDMQSEEELIRTRRIEADKITAKAKKHATRASKATIIKKITEKSHQTTRSDEVEEWSEENMKKGRIDEENFITQLVMKNRRYVKSVFENKDKQEHVFNKNMTSLSNQEVFVSNGEGESEATNTLGSRDRTSNQGSVRDCEATNTLSSRDRTSKYGSFVSVCQGESEALNTRGGRVRTSNQESLSAFVSNGEGESEAMNTLGSRGRTSNQGSGRDCESTNTLGSRDRTSKYGSVVSGYQGESEAPNTLGGRERMSDQERMTRQKSTMTSQPDAYRQQPVDERSRRRNASELKQWGSMDKSMKQRIEEEDRKTERSNRSMRALDIREMNHKTAAKIRLERPEDTEIGVRKELEQVVDTMKCFQPCDHTKISRETWDTKVMRMFIRR